MTSPGREPETTAVFSPFVTQVCKGVATLMLLAHHLFFNPNPALYSESLHVFALKCKACVAMFLMLSGAGITLSGCTWRRTYVYRIPKMLLNYWFVGLVFVFVGVTFHGMTFEAAYPTGTGWTFWLQLFGVNWITPIKGFNPTWWFMDAIMPLYFVSPISYMLVQWNPIVIVVAAFVASLFPWDFYLWIIPFAFGMAAAAMNSFERFAEKRNAIAGLFVCLVFLGLSYRYHTRISQHFMIAFFLISIICSLCAIGGRACEIVFSPLAFIGRHSMNVFLLHTFFLIWYAGFFSMNKPYVTYPILLAVSLACSIAVENMKVLMRFQTFISFLKRVAR